MKQHNLNTADYVNHSSTQLKWPMELFNSITLSGTKDHCEVLRSDEKTTSLFFKKCFQGNVVGIDQDSIVELGQSIHDYSSIFREPHRKLKSYRRYFMSITATLDVGNFNLIIDFMVNQDEKGV